MSSILQKQTAIASALSLGAANAETLVAYSGRVEATYPTLRYIIKGWAQIAFGTGVTGLILRLRRGNGVNGAVAAGGNTQTATLSTTDDFAIVFNEQILNAEFQDYSLTAQTVGATGVCTVNLGTIEVETING